MYTARSVYGTALLLCAGLLIARPDTASGQAMYAGGPGDELYQIINYTSSPAAINIRHTGIDLYDIAVSPNGTGYAVSPSGLYRVNFSTGATALISNQDTSFNALLAASDTTLYAMGSNDAHLFSLNTTTGAETEIFNTGFTSAGDIAFGPGGKDLYLSAGNGHLVSLNLTNDTATDLGAFGVGDVYGLAFVNGVLYAGSDDGPALYTVNTSDGHATLIGNIAGAGNLGLGGLAVSPSVAGKPAPAVPEPTIYSLLGSISLVSTALLRRKRTR